MTIYRIEHRGIIYNDQGKSEWDFWHPCGKKIYLSKELAEKALANSELQSDCNNEYRVKEVICDKDIVP